MADYRTPPPGYVPEPEPEKKPPAANQNTKTQKDTRPKITGAEKEQKRLFKYRRGGVVITEDQVKEIKAGRKKLRKDMRAMGIKSKKEFEVTASGLGLYFDKNRFWMFWLWFLRNKRLLGLLGAALLTLAGFKLYSDITQMRGFFTINLTKDLFKEGLSLSDTVEFKNPTSALFSDPVYDAPCISMRDIPEDLDATDGSHNGKTYFAYTFYARNEGENIIDYDWQLKLNSESLNVSQAAWVTVYVDGKAAIYAKTDKNGKPEALPGYDINNAGYTKMPFFNDCADPDSQYETIATRGTRSIYRVISKPFESDSVVCSGTFNNVKPLEKHKFTVVIWLEGDDPECTDDVIGGHLGFEYDFKLASEADYG